MTRQRAKPICFVSSSNWSMMPPSSGRSSTYAISRGFNYVERILLHKDPRSPAIFRCEAVSTGMYIFDPHGDVHVCLEAAGDQTLRIGRYDPVWELNEDDAAMWSRRTVLDIEKCTNCKIRFVCAGGCSMERLNGQSGCMPFLEEMEIAWDYFARTRPELFA